MNACNYIQSWSYDIGFNTAPTDIIKVPMNKDKEASMLKHYYFISNDRRCLTPHPTPMYESNEISEVDNNMPLPIFSSIYFDVTPLRCCHSIMLHKYVISIMMAEDSKTRKQLISTAQRLYDLKKLILKPDKTSTQTNSWSLQGAMQPDNESA